MWRFVSISMSLHWNGPSLALGGATLIYGSVSAGNVAYLAQDVIISSLGLKVSQKDRARQQQ